MEIRQLRYFKEVAEREHISDAAIHLHVAQSAVSRQIANLESELGVELFERIGRNVKLTPIGKIFLEHCLSALQAIDFAKKQIDEYLDPEKGTIKIGFPTSLAGHLLPTVISAFKKEHPNVAFQLRQGSYNHLIEAVKKRDINIAFLGPLPPKDNTINTTILFSENFSVLVPTNHRFAKREKIPLIDMREEDFVLFPKGYILHKLVYDACHSVGFTPKSSSVGEDMVAIKGLVAAGVGITILPDSTFYDSIPRFTTKVPLVSPPLQRTVGMISPVTRDLSPSEKVFHDFTIQFFKLLNQYQ